MVMGRLQDEMQRFAALIDDRMLTILKEKQMDANAVLSEMYDILIDFTMRGGKRIRPLLVYFGHRAVKEPDDLLDVACAVELVHVFLLIHDDIIDRDVLRRGGPTVNKSYIDIFNERYEGDEDHFGNSMALLVGDLAYTLAIELLKDHPAIISILSDSIQKTIAGEALDILSEYNVPSETELIDMMRLKTAYYTFYLPMAIGCEMAGGKFLKELEKISIEIGLAFQIQDDIMDIYSEKTGKDPVSDVKQGKMTLIYSNALSKANKKDKEFLKSQLGVADSPEKIQDTIVKTGALDYANDLVNEHSTKARELISASEMRDCTKEFLIDLIDNLLKRES